MRDLFAAAIDSVLDLQPPTILAGLVLALILSSPVALAYAASRRGRLNMAFPLLGLAAAANLLAMALAVGHVRSAAGAGATPSDFRSQHPAPRYGVRSRPELMHPENGQAGPLARGIIERADGDGDGRLSAAEAAAEAAAIIESIGAGRGTVDEKALRDYIRMRLRAAWTAGAPGRKDPDPR